jgi:hypothetical protein
MGKERGMGSAARAGPFYPGRRAIPRHRHSSFGSDALTWRTGMLLMPLLAALVFVRLEQQLWRTVKNRWLRDDGVCVQERGFEATHDLCRSQEVYHATRTGSHRYEEMILALRREGNKTREKKKKKRPYRLQIL